MKRYEFRVADGSVCCSTTNVRNLCSTCKARALNPSEPRAAVSASELKAATAQSVEFRDVQTGKTFVANNLRHLCSPMQELRDSVPEQFKSQMDWAKFFAASGAPEPPDGYAVAIAAAKPTAIRPPSARMATGHTGAPDGYADNLPSATAPGVDPLDGYAVALSERADVHPFPATTDGYAAAIARRKVS